MLPFVAFVAGLLTLWAWVGLDCLVERLGSPRVKRAWLRLRDPPKPQEVVKVFGNNDRVKSVIHPRREGKTRYSNHGSVATEHLRPIFFHSSTSITFGKQNPVLRLIVALSGRRLVGYRAGDKAGGSLVWSAAISMLNCSQRIPPWP